MKNKIQIKAAALFLLAVFILLLAPAVSAQRLWPHDQGDIPPDPDVIFGRLENGFLYALKKNMMPKDRVSMHLIVQAGSLQEEDDQRGLAHFLEHMLFNGSRHFPPGELVKFFQSQGMQFGPDANAHTGFDRTVYDIVLADGSVESIKKALLVIDDYLRGALLLPGEVEKEKKVILAEKRARDSASYRTFKKTLSFELPGSLVARRLPIGTEEVIASAKSEDLKRFYDMWYRPDRTVLVIVGDFDPEKIEPLVRKRFSSFTPRAPAGRDPRLGKISHKGVEAFYHFEKEAGGTRVSIEMVESLPPYIDTVENRRNDLLMELGNRIVQHRLERILAKDKAPFVEAGISTGLFLRQIRFSEISAQSEPGSWKDALKTIQRELERARRFGFLPSELKRVKKELVSSLRSDAEKAGTKRSGEIARELIDSLVKNKSFLSPAQRLDLAERLLKGISPKQVHAYFSRVWGVDHRLVLVTGNAVIGDKVKSPEQVIKEAFYRAGKTGVRPYEERKVKSFPYLPVPQKKGRIAESRLIDDLGIRSITFENGVRLNIKKTPFEKNRVLINAIFGYGRSTEPESVPGLGIVAEMVVNESGLNALDKEELEDALAGKTVSLGFVVKDEAFSFRGDASKQETKLLLRLLYARIKDQAFRKSALDLVLRRLENEYDRLTHSIDGQIPLKVLGYLAGGDSRFGWPSIDEFKRISIGDVARWVSSAMSSFPLEISVVGDLDEDVIISEVSRLFGTLEFAVPLSVPSAGILGSFPAGKRLIIPVKTKINKGLVQVAFMTGDIWDIKRTRRLSALSSVFAEKMRIRLRERLGVSYSPYAVNRPSEIYKGYGIFYAMSHVRPDHARTAISEMKKIAMDLGSKSIGRDELNRTIKPIITGIREMRQKNEYWLETVLSGSGRHPERIEWSRSIMDDYSSITAEDIRNMAYLYLKDERAAEIVILPQKIR